MTDLRPLVLINDVPLTECEYQRAGDGGAEFSGFDPERRRVVIWTHPDVTPGFLNEDGEGPNEIMERATYAEVGERLPALENTALPEPQPATWDCGCRYPGSLGGDCDGSCQHPPEPEPAPFVFPVTAVPFKLPWEK